jgi:hypothetical protein
MIKWKAQVSQNCHDNKCKHSSQSRIIIHFAVAAQEYSNAVGERFWRDYSFKFPVLTALSTGYVMYAVHV